MTGRQMLIALSAAIALGFTGASMAQANDKESSDYHGGFKIGPQGQVMGAPRRTESGSAYAAQSNRHAPASRRKSED